MIDCIASVHTNPWTCGIAKWNTALGERLGVPVVPLRDVTPAATPLVSVACRELDAALIASLTPWLDARPTYDILLHGVCESAIEARLILNARRRFGANREIATTIDGTALWCPSPADLSRPQVPTIRILTFGMVHKIRVEHYTKLRALLDGYEYVVELSTALHEGTPWSSALEALADRLVAIFGRRVRVLGYLADGALLDRLQSATAVAAFFPGGVRENNTSVWTAMAAGCPVVTNLDEASGPIFRHGATVLDIERLTAWPAPMHLAAVRAGARALTAEYGWARLCEVLRA